jgi:hypothetical protein
MKLRVEDYLFGSNQPLNGAYLTMTFLKDLMTFICMIQTDLSQHTGVAQYRTIHGITGEVVKEKVSNKSFQKKTSISPETE